MMEQQREQYAQLQESINNMAQQDKILNEIYIVKRTMAKNSSKYGHESSSSDEDADIIKCTLDYIQNDFQVLLNCATEF
ncbi:hypothetical protein Ahy_A03g010144 isoform B [Arachis hypogaea]|uniref:Uncharacterized protein n=1 Tax=Arachis hypogaea TaxID=3818 RepID=A0A445DLA6_ARAHY|nr:hypothetical protein Ahy_A03g010144 isoform B [Arachis hypogaea]